MAGIFVDVIAYVVFIFVVLMFFMIYAHKPAAPLESKISSEAMDSSTRLMLHNLLRSPMPSPNAHLNLADLMVMSKGDELAIRGVVRDLVRPFCSQDCQWRVIIDYGDKKIGAYSIVDIVPVTLAKQAIPSKDGTIIVTLELGGMFMPTPMPTIV